MERIHNPEILAYLAGIIDGEGYIGIRRSILQRARKYNYEIQLQVSNTDRRLIDWLLSLPIRASTDSIGPKGRYSKKPLYRWTVTGREAQSIITQILPYSIIKQDQMCLTLMISIGLPGQKLSSTEQKIREFVYWALKKLHKGGQNAEDT